MKKQIVAVLAIVLGITQANAQEGSNTWNKLSLEASYGFAMPLSPTENIEAADYNSLVNFQGGVNYQVNNLWGVRATYAYQKFENKDFSNLGVAYHKFMGEATFNVLEAVNPTSSSVQSNNFEIVAHAGIGGSFATRNQDNKTNKMINAQIGVKPTYAVSNRVNIFADVTYVTNFNQAYEFSGTAIKGGTTGGYVTANVGLQVKLGK